MRAQAQELVKIAKALKVEIQKQEYFDSRVQINDYVDVYANDVKDYIHVQFNRHGKPVDITIHDYNEVHYTESLSIDLSIIDHELDKIVERSKNVVDEFIHIFSNRSEEIKQQRIRDLELEISKLRGDVPVI
jgi:hypothetical protein